MFYMHWVSSSWLSQIHTLSPSPSLPPEDRISLCSLGWPYCYITQVGLKFVVLLFSFVLTLLVQTPILSDSKY